MKILFYRKTYHRQPVSLGICFPFADPQAQIPAGWCMNCGREIFSQGENFCPECRIEKEKSYDRFY